MAAFRKFFTSQNKAYKPASAVSRIKIMALEPRIMFDGAAVTTAVATTPTPANNTSNANIANNNSAENAGATIIAKISDPLANVQVPIEVRTADPSLDNGKTEAVFIDTSVNNYQTIEAGIRAGVAIYEINPNQDGLAQIAKWAESNSNYDAIHIISHGETATLDIGSTTLNLTDINNATIATELVQIGSSLSTSGDLLLYGCNIASNSFGQNLVNDIARDTGRVVAAATNPIGSSALGGNWNLGYTTGTLNVTSLSVSAYDGLLDYSTPTASYTIDALGSGYYVMSAIGLPNDKSAVLLGNYSTNSESLRLYDSSGSQLFSINPNSLSSTIKPSAEEYHIFPLSNGNIVFEYNSSDSSGNTNYNAYFQILNQSGSVVVGQTQINGTGYAMGSQSRYVNMTQLSNGNIAFSWQRGDNVSFGTRIFSTAGTAVTGEIYVAGANGVNNSIVSSSNGTFLIDYDYNTSSGGNNISHTDYKIYSNAGTLQSSGSFFSGAVNYEYTAMINLPNGNYLLEIATSSGITGEILNASAVQQGSSITLANMGAGNVAAVSTANAQGFVVTSYSYSPTFNYGQDWTGTERLQLQYYNLSGALVSTTPIDSGPGWMVYNAASFYYSSSYAPSYYVFSGYSRGLGEIKTDYQNVASTSGTDIRHRIVAQIFDEPNGPAVSGGTASQVINDTVTTTKPLSGVTVSDPTSENLTITVTIKGGTNLGDLGNTGGWTSGTNGSDKTYSETFSSVSAANTAIQNLTWTAVAHIGTPGTSSAAKEIDVTVSNGTVSSTDTTNSVVVSYTETAPTSSGGGNTVTSSSGAAVSIDHTIGFNSTGYNATLANNSGNWSGGNLTINIPTNRDTSHDILTIFNTTGGITTSNNGGVNPNRRKFRRIVFKRYSPIIPATIASRSILCPLSLKA